MSYPKRRSSLSPEEFRRAVEEIAERSSDEFARAQQRLALIRPRRMAA